MVLRSATLRAEVYRLLDVAGSLPNVRGESSEYDKSVPCLRSSASLGRVTTNQVVDWIV